MFIVLLIAVTFLSLPTAALFTSRRPRLLAWLANLSLAYPLAVLGSIYGDWLMSWHMLGHKPEWSVDDPKYIEGTAWIYALSVFASIGILPVGFWGLAFNVLHNLKKQLSAAQAGIRITTFVSLWLGMLTWIYRDPHGIMEWWLD